MAAQDPNHRGIMVDDLSRGRRPLGSLGGVAEFAVDAAGNVTGLVGPRGVKIIDLTRRGRKVVLFGDSITGQNVVPPGGGYAECYAAQGYFVQASIELGWPFTIVDAGVSGNTTTQMLARITEDVLDESPDICVVMGGTNDIAGTLTASEISDNIKSMCAKLRGIGATVVLCTITPTTAHTTTPKYGKKRSDINAELKRYASANSGIILADTERAILDPATGGPLSGTTTDGIHPSNIGARKLGRCVADAMSGIVPAWSEGGAADNGYAINPLANGSNAAGSGGFTAQTGITGVGPNGWDAGVRNTGAAVLSKVTRSNDWRPDTLLRIAATFTANMDGVYVTTGGSDRVGVAKGRYDQYWAANTAYGLNDRKKPTVANGYHYVVTVAGTTHATTEPTWPTTEGETVTDGTVTWRCHRTPINGDQFFATAEVDTSALTGGAQPVLTLHVGYTDGTYQDVVACGFLDLGASYGQAPDQIPTTGRLVTPPLTLDLSAKSLRYLFAKLAVYGPAGGGVTLDVTRFDIVRV